MKSVLFVCVENSCRSQMAEGLARHYFTDRLKAYSAGSNPSGVVNPNAIEVMKEMGIDISAAKSKGFEDLGIDKFDYVVTLGCKDRCPFVPSDEHMDWDIEDPKGKPLEDFKKARDHIKEKLHVFL